MKEVVRLFRLLMTLKRAGKTSTLGIRPGELVFPCPTCARVGVNLPPDWRTRKMGCVTLLCQLNITLFNVGRWE